MGIHGLLPLLTEASQHVNIKQFHGTVAAVDVYSWLHKGVAGCADRLFMGFDDKRYVDYCLRRVKLLTDANVTPILVFDGANLPAKAITDSMRHEKKEKVRARITAKLEQDALKEAQDLMRQCTSVTQEIALNLIKACRENNINYLVAPYEADAQIVYLLKANIADFAISEDSDLILMNCDYVLTKLEFDGNGILIRRDRLYKCFPNFDFEIFRRMCILSGCDYLPSLKGIGIGKARAFFEKVKEKDIDKALRKLPRILNMKQLHVTDDYIEGFMKAENTFKYQVVYCPLKRCLRPLNDYAYGISSENLTYAGPYFDDKLAQEFSVGNVDLNTMEVIDSFVPPKEFILNVRARKKSVFEAIIEKNSGYMKLKPPSAYNKKRKSKTINTSLTEKKQRISVGLSDEELVSQYYNSSASQESLPTTLSSASSSSQSSASSSQQCTAASSLSSTSSCKVLKAIDNRAYVRSRYFAQNEASSENSNLTYKSIYAEQQEKRRKISFLYEKKIQIREDIENNTDSESECDVESILEELRNESICSSVA